MASHHDRDATLEALRHFMPVAAGEADLSAGKIGVVLVDLVVGFTREGALSDPASMQPMVDEVDRVCRALLAGLGERVAFFVFRDCHDPGQLEPPYPPHCQRGTGEELLDPKLRWLEAEARVTVFDKDCINGMIGAMAPAEVGADGGQATLWRHRFVEWARAEGVERMLVMGDCTDICDLDFVVSALSARNHGMFGDAGRAMPVMVYAPGCATYHLPDPAGLGLPETARHDGPLCHHAALYFMQARGASVVDRYRL